MNSLNRLLHANHPTEWVAAATVALALAAVLLFARRVLVRRFGAYARTTATPIDDVIADMLGATKHVFLVLMALYAATQFLELPPRVAKVVDSAAIIAILAQAALWANRGILAWLTRYMREKQQTDAASATTVTVIGFVARVAVWALIVLMILDNLGFNITTLVASLGIGGIAVALAVQNILGDIFASLSIALDKPFVIGDFIVIDDVMGTVEYIGLKTTRLRSLSGEQIACSNADLLKSRIRNYKRMAERRIQFSFGITYQTPCEKLERIPAMVREIIEQEPKTRFDRAHFKGYGDSSLDFEVVYYVLSPDYNVYMDIQQAINLALFRRFAQEKIEFAYPTRTLYMQSAAPPAPAHP
jgi:small-conductance mechanosensitive channel